MAYWPAHASAIAIQKLLLALYVSPNNATAIINCMISSITGIAVRLSARYTVPANTSNPQLASTQAADADCENRPERGIAWFCRIQAPVRRCHQILLSSRAESCRAWHTPAIVNVATAARTRIG